MCLCIYIIYETNVKHTSAFFLFLAIGKLTFHESANSTFKEAKDTCQQEGGELVRDLGFLWVRNTWISSTMRKKYMTRAWIEKHLIPLKFGMFSKTKSTI